MLKEDAEEEEGGLKELLPDRRPIGYVRRLIGRILRCRLPNGRGGFNVTLFSRHLGKEISLTVNDYENGEQGEVFVHGLPDGSRAHHSLVEFCTLLSIALQYGMPVEEFAGNLQRERNGEVLTIQGEIIEALMKGSST